MQNLRLAVRSLVKRPAFFALVVAVIAIGVGANTAIFSVVDAVLLRPLPYADPDRLAFLLGTSNGRSGSMSILDFRDVVERSRAIETAALYGASPSTLSGPSDAEPLAAFRVSPSLFSVLRVAAAYGRVFDDSADRGSAILMSDSLWRRRFGGDPRIVGQAVRVNGAPRTVVGVMPAGFAFPERAEAWVPLEPTSDELRPNNRGAHFLSAIARVKPGMSFVQARQEVEAIGAVLARDYPSTNRDRSTTLAPAAERIVESSRPALLFLSGAVGCVLLIACANVSNLLLVRASARRREIAMRLALGASRAQIVRALVAESVVVAVAAAVAGLLLGAWVVRGAMALVPQDLPHAQQIGINARVLTFATLLSLVATVACSVVPALVATEGAIAEVIREGRTPEGDRGRARRLFVVAEVALALMLLVGAGVSIRSVQALTRLDAGFNADRVLSARVTLPRTRYTPPRVVDTFARLIAAVRARPGVTAAALVAFAPFEGRSFGGSFHAEAVEAPPDRDLTAQVRAVSDDYFRTMEIARVRGRAIESGDVGSSAPVAVLNAAAVRAYWGALDPIGRHLTLDVGVVPGPSVEREIVGVVADVKLGRLDEAAAPVIYVPHPQYPAATMTLVARTAGDPMSAVPLVRHELAVIDRDLTLEDVQPMTARVAGSSSDLTFRTWLLASFAAVALVLAVIGLYAVIAYSVAQRTREIGVRMALGADAEQVLRLVFREGMPPVMAGAVLGLAGAIGLSRLVSSLVIAVRADDPATLAGVTALLVGAALAACYVPARRAIRVNPVVALRVE